MTWRALFAAAVVVASVLPLTSSLWTESFASNVPFTPAIIARAGTTDIFYVLSESNACGIRECLRLERSDNDGRTFIPEAVPPVTPVLGGSVAPIGNLYFANPRDGYAEEFTSTGAKWATTSIFLTRDGGRSLGQGVGRSARLNIWICEYFSLLLRADGAVLRWKEGDMQPHRTQPLLGRNVEVGNAGASAPG